MSESKPQYTFHLLGIMICLGLLAFTINRLYYSKPERSIVPGNNPVKHGVDTVR